MIPKQLIQVNWERLLLGRKDYVHKRVLMTKIGTLLMILSGILPILNNIICLFIDLNAFSYAGFPNMNVAVFQYSLLIVPFFLIPAVVLRAYWISYLIPIFTYTNIILLYLSYHYGLFEDEKWLFYSTIAGISLLILIFYGNIREYYFNLIEEDDINNEIIELYRKDHENKG